MIGSYDICMHGMISREWNSAVKENQRVGQHCYIVGETKTCLLLHVQCNNDVTPYTVGVTDLRHSAPAK